MEYRRFGKTGKEISVITLGGMRYKHGWDKPRDVLPRDSIDNCLEITLKAFEVGINHIETAYGYNKSEGLYGVVLSQIERKRESYYLMTKGNADTPDEFKRLIDGQLKTLGVDYVDFYAYHGINNREIFNDVFEKDRMVNVLRDYKEQGVIKHIGFSTHAAPDVILDTVNTDHFEFVNLHYYYFNQRNRDIIKLAGKKDMGVFIISPNDKGGQLWNAPERVKRVCAPLTPVQFNGRFCLSHPEITTLSMGLHELGHFDDPLGILAGDYTTTEFERPKKWMDNFIRAQGEPVCNLCGKCMPCPQRINIPHVLRMWNMYKYYDMLDFGKYRYNMFEKEGHWFPGTFGNECSDCNVCLPRCPEKLNIPELVRKAHEKFYVEKKEE